MADLTPPATSLTGPDPSAPEARAADAPVSARLLAWCDRNRLWLLLVVVLLYAVAYNVHWRPHTDSAVHLSIAQNIVAGAGYVHPTGDEVRVNPGLSYLLAGTMLIVGTNAEQLWLANAVMLGLGLLTLAVAFTLFRTVAGRATAVLLTVMLAVSLTFLGHALQLLTDIPFLLGALLFLLGWAQWTRRGRLGVTSVAAILAGATLMVLFRTVAITFLGAAALALAGFAWQHRRERRVRLATAALAGVIVLGLAVAALTSAGLSGAEGTALVTDRPADDLSLIRERLGDLNRLLGEHVPGNLTAILTDNLAVAVFGVNFGPAINLALAVAVLGATLTLVRRQPLWVLMIAALLVQMLVFLSARRYFLAILPMLLMGWWYAALWLEQRLPRPWAGAAVVLMVALWAVPNTVRSLDQVLEQRERPYLAHLSDGKYDDYHRLALRLADDTEPGAVIVAAAAAPAQLDHAVLRYWSDRLMVNPHQFRSLADVTGPIYVIEPTGERLARLIDARGWALSEPVLELEPTHLDVAVWSLRRVTDFDDELTTDAGAGTATWPAAGAAP